MRSRVSQMSFDLGDLKPCFMVCLHKRSATPQNKMEHEKCYPQNSSMIFPSACINILGAMLGSNSKCLWD